MDGTIRIGIDTSVADALLVRSSNVTLRGLAITGSAMSHIDIDNSNNFVLTGSYVGVTQTGHDNYWGAFNQYGTGVIINSSDDVRIGGSTAQDRNVIGRCRGNCIEVKGTNANTSTNIDILGNNISIASDSVAGLPNNGLPTTEGGIGINIQRYTSDIEIGDSASHVGNYLSYNTLGAIAITDSSQISMMANLIIDNTNYWSGQPGPEEGAGITLMGATDITIGDNNSLNKNVIAGNQRGGLTIIASPNTSAASSNISVVKNYFGVMQDGVTAFPNENHSGNIAISDNSNTILIKENIIHNTIADFGITTSDGISVRDNAQKIAILQNSIYNNNDLGIDINGDGVSVNDSNDGDGGPNSQLNSPGYTNITENAGNTDVTFTLDVPAGDYRIEFFSNTVADPSGIGEGETYLGSVTISHTGSGLEQFSHTLTGTGHTHLALTATEIDPSTPSGFGATSEFGGAGVPAQCPPGYVGTPPNCETPPVTDLALTSVLTNPEDFALGNILNFQMTITNYGPDNVDISTMNDLNPSNNNFLINGILNPQLTFSGSSGDVACTYFGGGSAIFYGPALGNHSDHGIYVCGYSGTSPRILSPGQSMSFTISAEIVDDSNPTFRSYATVLPLVSDPDLSVISSAYSSGNDIVDYFTQTHFVNNFSWASSTPTDIEIIKTLDNPENMVSGATVNYNLTMTNNGPSSINPNSFNTSGPNPLATSLFTDLLPPNLTYISSSNPDVVCNYIGPASMVGGALESVSTHHIIICGYFGPITSLAAGQSISTTLSAAVNSVPAEFTNYAIGAMDQNDPDWQVIFSTLYRGGDLIEDVAPKNINNLSSATYTTSYDHDSDGVADQVEDNTAPGGDGNGDGTADKLQSDVTSTLNPVTGKHTTLAVAGDCNTVTDMTVVPEATLSHLDTGYDYPLGLNDFTLDCSTPGGSATVTVYYDKVYDTTNWNIRKFIDATYTSLSSASISQATVNGTPVTTITYSLRDGSSTDDDNATNSAIDDPTGPALQASASSTLSSSLANTGSYAFIWLIVGLILVGVGITIGKTRDRVRVV
jgi:hypothetical protein